MLAKLDEAVATCREDGERLVLVVDGLDEDRGTGGHSVAALLPACPAAGMRVIVAIRPNQPLPPDVARTIPCATGRRCGRCRSPRMPRRPGRTHSGRSSG